MAAAWPMFHGEEPEQQTFCPDRLRAAGVDQGPWPVRSPLYVAVITHKGRQVAQLIGDDRKALQARAHCYAANQNYHRAVVQIRPN